MSLHGTHRKREVWGSPIPIIIYVRIENCKVKFGMIKLGFHTIGVYNKKEKSIWHINGSVIINGSLFLGSGFALSVEPYGLIKFGHNVVCSAMIKIICQDSITIGANTRVAWEVIISDTNFHWLKNFETGERNKKSSPVVIGENNWIGLRTLVWKGTRTPNFCTVSGNSVLNRYYDIPECAILGGNPAKLIKVGWYRDLSD